MTTFVAPIEKFRDYIFKSGATHGKDHVFRSLGYDVTHSAILAELYASQAERKYNAKILRWARLMSTARESILR